MPHQCTNCGQTFADGSKEMLSGCPDCGGNKFQFHHGSVPEEPPADAAPPPPGGDGSSVANAVGKAANTVRDIVGSSDDPPAGPEESTPGTVSSPGSAVGADEPARGDAPVDAAARAGADVAGGAAGSGAPDTETDADSDSGSAPSPSSGGPVERAEKRFPHEDGHDAIVEHASDRDAAGESSGSSGDGPSALDREWPAVSRPDEPEDTAQAAARSGFADPDVETTDGDDGSGKGAGNSNGDSVDDAGDSDSVGDTRDENDSDSASAEESAATADTDLGDIRIADEEPLDDATGQGDGSDAATASGIDTIGEASPADSASIDAGKPTDASEPADVRESTDESELADANEPVESPGLEDLRRELNDQFESIRIVEPGQYELNLMELYNREEYIIALQENGRYVIEVPDTWRG